MGTAGPASPGEPPWRIASFCNGGSCVRVALMNQTVLLGDTKSPDGPVLSYTWPQWNDFIERIKRGEYDSH
jgi:hypothetical protein